MDDRSNFEFAVSARSARREIVALLQILHRGAAVAPLRRQDHTHRLAVIEVNRERLTKHPTLGVPCGPLRRGQWNGPDPAAIG